MQLQPPTSTHVRLYAPSEHSIQRQHIDTDVISIVHKLRRNGYHCYVVGGAVRDLLLGITPKDFDLATNASPNTIRSIFTRCRIIGKRFRLAHIYSGNRIIEVATFRSVRDTDKYGSIEEDVLRRDFTVNGLYYDIRHQMVIDYVGGMNDIVDKKLNAILPIEMIFKDDPVRMIRAIKYACHLGLTVNPDILKAIKRDGKLLTNTSSSRCTEEMIKIIKSSSAANTIEMLYEQRLLHYLQPTVSRVLKNKKKREALLTSLRRISKNPPQMKGANRVLGYQFSGYLYDMLVHHLPCDLPTALQAVKKFIAPITPPNIVLGHAIRYVERYTEQQARRNEPRNALPDKLSARSHNKRRTK